MAKSKAMGTLFSPTDNPTKNEDNTTENSDNPTENSDNPTENSDNPTENGDNPTLKTERSSLDRSPRSSFSRSECVRRVYPSNRLASLLRLTPTHPIDLRRYYV